MGFAGCTRNHYEQWGLESKVPVSLPSTFNKALNSWDIGVVYPARHLRAFVKGFKDGLGDSFVPLSPLIEVFADQGLKLAWRHEGFRVLFRNVEAVSSISMP